MITKVYILQPRETMLKGKVLSLNSCIRKEMN